MNSQELTELLTELAEESAPLSGDALRAGHIPHNPYFKEEE